MLSLALSPPVLTKASAQFYSLNAYSCFWVYEGFVQITDSVKMKVGLNELLKVVTDIRIFAVAAARKEDNTVTENLKPLKSIL